VIVELEAMPAEISQTSTIAPEGPESTWCFCGIVCHEQYYVPQKLTFGIEE
jgi:hypothetical protein